MEGNVITLLDLEMDTLLEDSEKMEALEGKDPAEIKEALKDVDGAKVETAEEVFVETK